MMRALWTAASGMTSQQTSVDVISNNLSNVNTTGFKKDRAEFQDLLYQTMNRASILNGTGRPVNLQVGHGSTLAATVKSFEIGSMDRTGNALDVAIDGEAFFSVQTSPDEIRYTRDGAFKISVNENGKTLTTTDGYPVLDAANQPINIANEVNIAKLNIGMDGALSYTDNTGNTVALGQSIGMVKFPNQYGLEAVGKNMFTTTSSSGAAVPDTELGQRSTMNQYFLESSNVKVVEEMVKLIVAQRAYEVNSKAIQSADDMLNTANNLRR